MRYEVLLAGVPLDRHSIVVEAPDPNTAILAAGIVLGKALKRNSIRFNAAAAKVNSVKPTDKPLKYQHIPNHT